MLPDPPQNRNPAPHGMPRSWKQLDEEGPDAERPTSKASRVSLVLLPPKSTSAAAKESGTRVSAASLRRAPPEEDGILLPTLCEHSATRPVQAHKARLADDMHSGQPSVVQVPEGRRLQVSRRITAKHVAGGVLLALTSYWALL